jgi:hypothetical protein
VRIIRTKSQYEEAKAELTDLKKAKKKVLEAQSYTIGANQLNRASLKEINDEIVELESAIDQYEQYGSSKRRVSRVVPL